MNQVVFTYKGKQINIQCDENNKMSDICSKFAKKAGVDKNNIFFCYDGKGGIDFNENQTFIQMAKHSNQINILVYDKKKNGEIIINKLKTKSKNVICPTCGENSLIKINNYKITLFDCKNGHKISNLSLKEFEDKQIIDLSNIKCGKCNNNKSSSFQNTFFNCLDCKINLCPLCKNSHDKNHNIIDYDYISYICQNHYDSYSKYCKYCKMNICMHCEGDHSNHTKIYLGDIIQNKKDLNSQLDELKTFIDKFNEDINKIIEIINEVKENLNLYYKIKKDLIDNYDNRNKNYELLINLEEIYNNNEIINDINKIYNHKDIIYKFNSILVLYNNINNKNYLTLEKEEENSNKKNKMLEGEFDRLNKMNDELSKIYTLLEKENKELKLIQKK
jgi:hypothetical protein